MSCHSVGTWPSTPIAFRQGARVIEDAVDRVIQELRAWKVPFQLEVYSGTGHGFSTPKNKAEERANAQSIASTARTLKELFGI